MDADAAAREVAGGQFEAAVAAAPARLRDTVQSEVPAAFFASIDDVFLLIAAVAATGAIAVASLVRGRDFVIPAGGADVRSV